MRANTFFLALGVMASVWAPAFAQTQPSNSAVLFPAPVMSLPAPVKASFSSSKRTTIATELKTKWWATANSRPGGATRWSRLLTEAVATADAEFVLRATTARTLDDLHKALAGGDISTNAAANVSAADGLGNGVTPQGILGTNYRADLVYTPLPKGRCRVYDTRTLGAPLVGTRNLEIESVESYASQGGTGTFANGTGSANCGISLYNGAYALSVTLITPTSNGSVKFFQYGDVPQMGNSLWMNGGTSGAGGDLTVESCIGCAFEIGINTPAAVHVIVDVIGYYRYAQLPTPSTPSCYSTTFVRTAIAANNVGKAEATKCATGYQRVDTTCWMHDYTGYLTGSFEGSCHGKTGNVASSVNARNLCCKLAGR